MEGESIDNQKCKNHPDKNFDFYCFNDKEFLCNKCYFKQHKNHDVEIGDDLKENLSLYKPLIQANLCIKDFFSNYKMSLEKLKNDIEEELNIVNQIVEELKNNSAPAPIGENIISLSFNEYKRLSTLSERKKKIKEMCQILNDLNKELNNNKSQKIFPSNYRIINKEVKILDQSQIYDNFSSDIMFGRATNCQYTLFNGNKNHFLVLDLGKKYFLKSIKIKCYCGDAECTPKNVKISCKNENDFWDCINNFQLQKKYNGEQTFEIGKELKYLKLDFIDNWSNKGGDYILINSINFEIGDIN